MELTGVCKKEDGGCFNVTLSWNQCVAMGYAGRDQASITTHINELKAIGVPVPDSVPSMYWIDPTRVLTANELYVVGENSSGEVEFFAAKDNNGETYITVASDHTDRWLETMSVSRAKQVCSKIIAPFFWQLSEIRSHWDDIILRSWVRETPGAVERMYQNGTLGQILPPEKLWALVTNDTVATNGQQIAYFSGTLPLIGAICCAGTFRMEMIDNKLGRRIEHSYVSVILPNRN